MTDQGVTRDSAHALEHAGGGVRPQRAHEGGVGVGVHLKCSRVGPPAESPSLPTRKLPESFLQCNMEG